MAMAALALQQSTVEAPEVAGHHDRKEERACAGRHDLPPVMKIELTEPNQKDVSDSQVEEAPKNVNRRR
jgi:hypothetical protein